MGLVLADMPSPRLVETPTMIGETCGMLSVAMFIAVGIVPDNTYFGLTTAVALVTLWRTSDRGCFPIAADEA